MVATFSLLLSGPATATPTKGKPRPVTTTYEKPKQYAIGVSHVLVNGKLVLADGEPTGVAAGQVVRGRGWKGWADGGCKPSAKDWSWGW